MAKTITHGILALAALAALVLNFALEWGFPDWLNYVCVGIIGMVSPKPLDILGSVLGKVRGKTAVLALLLVPLLGCAFLNKAVEFAQGSTMHQIDPAAIAIANDTRCDEQPTTYSEALAAFTVPIVEGNPTGKQTAAPLLLLVVKGFLTKPPADQLATFREELAHYCQRLLYPGYDQLYLLGYIDRPCRVKDGKCVGVLVPRSDFRWAFEVAAKRVRGQSVNLAAFVKDYKLGDLEPTQLAAETAKALTGDG